MTTISDSGQTTYPQLEYKSGDPDPYMTTPCPSWCIHGGEHKIELADCDRWHGGDIVTVPILAIQVEVCEYPDDDGTPTLWHTLGHCRMYVQQGIRDREPVVRVVLNESSVHVDLTIDEAETIGSALLAMVKVAR